mmetsp:Transcript_20956/g.29409  ORF Transcript_20956/g.29409 Transcript_20956/m.29409 type:complete len:201 (+) Transcript_20956:92-694(+)
MAPSEAYIKLQSCINEVYLSNNHSYSFDGVIKCNSEAPTWYYWILLYYTLTNVIVSTYLFRRVSYLRGLLNWIGLFGLVIGVVEHLSVHLPFLCMPLLVEIIIGRLTTLIGVDQIFYELVIHNDKSTTWNRICSSYLFKFVLISGHVAGIIDCFGFQGQLQTDDFEFHFKHAIFTHGGLVYLCFLRSTLVNNSKQKQKTA